VNINRTINDWDIEIDYPDKSFIVIEYDGGINTGKNK